MWWEEGGERGGDVVGWGERGGMVERGRQGALGGGGENGGEEGKMGGRW